MVHKSKMKDEFKACVYVNLDDVKDRHGFPKLGREEIHDTIADALFKKGFKLVEFD